jgi:hypothetical protein
VLLLARGLLKLIGSQFGRGGYVPEHMSYSVSDVERHPAVLSLVERRRTRRKVSRRSDCPQAVDMPLDTMAKTSLYLPVWRSEQDSNLRPTA